jgi:glycosyltransferase involved in cell wall biosynthesis
LEATRDERLPYLQTTCVLADTIDEARCGWGVPPDSPERLAAAIASVPSKIYKMMGSGRPVLAIAPLETQITRLVHAAQCGLCVPPGHPELLAAADLTLVTLNSAATLASVPSKIYKQMAAARPIVAITNPGNELTRLLEAGGCGVAVPPDDLQRLVSVFRRALAEQDAFVRMDLRGRAYLEQHCSRAKCVAAIEGVLSEA